MNQENSQETLMISLERKILQDAKTTEPSAWYHTQRKLLYDYWIGDYTLERMRKYKSNRFVFEKDTEQQILLVC